MIQATFQCKDCACLGWSLQPMCCGAGRLERRKTWEEKASRKKACKEKILRKKGSESVEKKRLEEKLSKKKRPWTERARQKRLAKMGQKRKLLENEWVKKCLQRNWSKKKVPRMNGRGLASDSRWFMLVRLVHWGGLVASTIPLIFWVSRFNETSFQFDE